MRRVLKSRPSGSMAIALLGAVAIGVGSGVGAFHYFGKGDVAVSVASLALALAVCLVVLIRDAAPNQRFTEAAGMRGELRRLGLHLDRLGNRLDALENAAGPADRAPLVAELEELRQRLGDLSPGHDIEPAPAEPELAPVSLLDH